MPGELRKLPAEMLKLDGTGALSWRNKIINGNFDIWQRGTSKAGINVMTYHTADRWMHSVYPNGTLTSEQIIAPAQPLVGYGSVKLLRMTKTSGTPTHIICSQRIEGVGTLQGKKATISFLARADPGAPKDIRVDLYCTQNFGAGGSPSAEVTFGSAAKPIPANNGNFSYITITFDVPSIQGKTIGTAGGDFLSIQISFELINGASVVDLAQVQLEEGSVATPFEQRPIGVELALCQRYYQKIDSIYMTPRTTANGEYVGGQRSLPVYMRAMPSIAYADQVGNVGKVTTRTSTTNHNVTFISGSVNASQHQVGWDAYVYNTSQSALSWVNICLIALTAEL